MANPNPEPNPSSNPNQARRPSLSGADSPPLIMQGQGGLERPPPRKMHSAPPRRRANSVPSMPSMSPTPLSPGDQTPVMHRRPSLPIAMVMAEVSLEQQIKNQAEAEAEAQARAKAKGEARAKAKVEARAKAEACQQQQKHVLELQKQLAMLDSACRTNTSAPKDEMREMRRGSPPGLRLGGDEMGLFSAALDTQVLDVSQMMGAPSPIEVPHGGGSPPFRRGVKTEMHDLPPEMQEDDWMTAYQGGGGEDQGELQSHLQAQLQAQLQLL